MKIAFITETFLPKIDGITNTLSYTLAHLHARNHQTLLLAPNCASTSQKIRLSDLAAFLKPAPIYNGIGPSKYITRGQTEAFKNTHIIQYTGFPLPVYPDLKLVPPWVSLIHSLRDFAPDIIHIVNPFSLGIAGIWATKQLNVPLVASYHTDSPGFIRRWQPGAIGNVISSLIWQFNTWLHSHAQLNLCPSQSTYSELHQRGFKHLKIWGRGVDTQRFSPTKYTTQWRNRLTNGNPQDPLLITVGRLSREKRIHWLRPILEQSPNLRLAIIGDGPARPELENLFAGTNTVFTGYLLGEELAHAYASADIFAFSSANETFGNVALEALASGLPVVAPQAGGVLDFIKHNHNGLLTAPESQTDFIHAILTLVHNPSLRSQLTQQARYDAENRSWGRILDQLIEDYALTHQRFYTTNKTQPNKSKKMAVSWQPESFA